MHLYSNPPRGSRMFQVNSPESSVNPSHADVTYAPSYFYYLKHPLPERSCAWEEASLLKKKVTLSLDLEAFFAREAGCRRL